MTALPIRIESDGPLFIAVEDAGALVHSDHADALFARSAGTGNAFHRYCPSTRDPFSDSRHGDARLHCTLPVLAETPPSAPPPTPLSSPLP